MNIIKIVKLKSGKYKLYLDNNETIITYDEVILVNNLLFHKQIDNDTIKKIKDENNYYELMNKAVNYISKRLRSEKEINYYLNKQTKDIYMIDKIICELKNKHLIDDRNFTKAYINDKINLSNNGILKIKKDLQKLGVSKQIIEEEIDNMKLKSDNNKLKKMIEKKIKSNNKYSSNYLKQKIINDMINLGYEKKEIINIIKNYQIDDSKTYQKEYDRLFNKLNKKYQGSELEFQVRKRLIAKGFKK